MYKSSRTKSHYKERHKILCTIKSKFIEENSKREMRIKERSFQRKTQRRFAAKNLFRTTFVTTEVLVTMSGQYYNKVSYETNEQIVCN